MAIGWLSINTRRGPNECNDGMAALGWKLGTHCVLEQRHAHGRVERLPALAQRWPAVGVQESIPAPGGLFSYGAKPGDLPIEQPTTFDLVLNPKTAAKLGIVIPPAMQVRATELIE